MATDEFGAVDALLKQAQQRAAMPSPAERLRLRTAADLSRAQVAQAVGTTRQTVANWEAGTSEPRPPARERYLRLLEGLAALHPAPGEGVDRSPKPYTGSKVMQGVWPGSSNGTCASPTVPASSGQPAPPSATRPLPS